jgi:hypothetical protein
MIVVLADSPLSIYTVLSAALGGGFITAVLRVYRARPEKDRVVVSGAQNAAEILRGTSEAVYVDFQRERERRERAELWSSALEDELRTQGLRIPYEKRAP